MVDTPHSGITHFEENDNPEVLFNDAIDDLDEGLNGYHIETITGDHDFTADLDADGDSVWHRARTIEITGTISGLALITVPNAETAKLIWNNTTGGFPIRIEANAGSPSGLTLDIPWAGRALIAVNPTGGVRNFYDQIFAGSILFDDGSAAAPSIRFANDLDTGLFRAGDGVVGFASGGVEAARIDATRLLLNETVNANQAAGITIQQGAADNEILTFKSSDIAHSQTGDTESDTFAFFQKASGSLGGLSIRTFVDDIPSGGRVSLSLDAGDFTITGEVASLRAVNIPRTDVDGSGSPSPTVTDASILYIADSPNALNDAIILNSYSIFVDAGISRFDGDGTHVFELPDDTGAVGSSYGRVPILMNGVTKYLEVFN